MEHTPLGKFTPVFGLQPDRHLGIGRYLLEDGAITSEQLFDAAQQQNKLNSPIANILFAEGTITANQRLRAQSTYFGAPIVDLSQAPPDDRLQSILPPEVCLRHAVVPWINIHGTLMLATSRPETIEKLRSQYQSELQSTQIVLASEDTILAYLAQTHRLHLLTHAETCVADSESCRSWGNAPVLRYIGFSALLAMCILSFTAETSLAVISLTFLAVAMQSMTAFMKVFAFAASQSPRKPPDTLPMGENLPHISVLVPLYKETEIAGALIRRLSRLTYPKALLDVVMVLEEKDHLTQDTLAATDLPNWIRTVRVPEGDGLTTKPRAMNYALDFCKGDIIGIWDAEDAPAPNQLETIAFQFAHADKDVACLQGILDYYNPYTNWLSRCFTLEYSMWFRIVLRGMSRLGAAIPLGGTTLYFRRDILEKIGRWDAHNVTEDADLGIRLCSYGYRTELAATVTQEEANCQMYRWIKQRSRWLKGYMITYLVHMRRPLRLWRRLGLRKFLGFNAIFLSTLSQFLLAPFIWSFWGLAFGFSLPWFQGLPKPVLYSAIGLFLFVSLLDILIAAVSMIGQNRNGLIGWALTLPIYFPLATLGAYKALLELIVVPFYWDKTTHGQTPEGQNAEFSAVSS